MAGRFLIPVSRFREAVLTSSSYTGPPYDGVEKFAANTPVLPIASGRGAEEPEVQVLQNSRYGYTRTRYRVLFSSRWSRSQEDVNPTRLELVPVGGRVLLELPAKRIQMIQTDDRGVEHIVEVADTSVTDHMLCGASVKYGSPVRTGVPSCLICLVEPKLWIPFFVQPYTHPRDRKKKLTKEERRQAEYERRPSVFDKLLDDAYLDPNIPEPPKPVFMIDPETLDETEDFVDPREAKVVTRAETNQRFKADKQALKAEIKAARRR